MRKRIMCLTLMLCLMLTACGGRGKETPPQSQVSLSSDSAGMEENHVLLTIDGREVPAWRYLYWLRRACETLCTEYEAAGMEVDWESRMGEETLAAYVKSKALADTALYATVENWGETHNCIPPQQQSSVAVKEGLSAAQAEELEQVGRLYGALYTLFCTPGSALAPTDEETAAFASENGWVGMEQILVPFGADQEAARKRAAELFSMLNAAEDPAAEFAAQAAGDSTGIRTIHLGEKMIAETLEDALAALEEGQFSGILESEDGYSILRRVAPDMDIVKEAYFDHLLLTDAANADIRCAGAYKTLDVAAFWETIQRPKGEK